jgi:hypothetical protein
MSGKDSLSDRKLLKDAIRSEYTKCATDIVYFMRNYVYIQNPVKGRVKFDLYKFQEDTLRSFQTNDRNIVLKSRQMGISTLCACYILWMMVFNPDKNCVIISKTQDAAKDLITKIRFGNENLPSFLKVAAVEDNRLSLRLKNGSQVKSVSSSKDSVRGQACSILVWDEMAFADSPEEIWLAVQPSIAVGGKIVILSTPNGLGNLFYKMWMDAESGRTNFNPIRLKWDLHPDRDQAWRDKQTLEQGVRQSAQECDTTFSSSGNTVINDEILTIYEEKTSPPIEKRGPSGNLHIWKYPVDGKRYMVSADVGRGDAEDYSACHVIDIETLEQVAEFEHKLDPKSYGNFLVGLATEYNDALLVIENNNIGFGTIQQVIDRNYRNLFYMTNDMKYVDVEEQMTNKLYSSEKKMTPGFLTSSRTRPLLISKFDLYMQQKEVIIHSKRLMLQLRTFIWMNGKAQAASGFNDDLCMAFAIAIWVRDTALRLENQSAHLTAAMINHIGSSYSKGLIPPSSNGVGGVYRAAGAPIRDPWSIQVGGLNEDLKWLIK